VTVSLRCPYCRGDAGSKVLETRNAGAITWRRLHCESVGCGLTFVSKEETKIYLAMPAQVGVAARRKRKEALLKPEPLPDPWKRKLDAGAA